jgi:hypothetical protein
VGLAARGTRDMDNGEVAVTDDAERSQLRAQARRVYARSLATAALLTAIALVIF